MKHTAQYGDLQAISHNTFVGNLLLHRHRKRNEPRAWCDWWGNTDFIGRKKFYFPNLGMVWLMGPSRSFQIHSRQMALIRLLTLAPRLRVKMTDVSFPSGTRWWCRGFLRSIVFFFFFIIIDDCRPSFYGCGRTSPNHSAFSLFDYLRGRRKRPLSCWDNVPNKRTLQHHRRRRIRALPFPPPIWLLFDGEWYPSFFFPVEVRPRVVYSSAGQTTRSNTFFEKKKRKLFPYKLNETKSGS